MTVLPGKHSNGCHIASHRGRGRPKRYGRRSGGDVDSRIQVQLEEERQWQCRRWTEISSVCMCSTGYDNAYVKIHQLLINSANLNGERFSQYLPKLLDDSLTALLILVTHCLPISNQHYHLNNNNVITNSGQCK